MSDRTCSIDGCERPIKARGWCGVHYDRVLKFGSPRSDLPIAPRPRKQICTVEGCTSTIGRHGRCPAHRRAERAACAFEGCDRLAGSHTQKLCNSHQRQMDRHGALTPLGRPFRTAGAILERDSASRKLCKRCDTWKPEAEFSTARKLPDGLQLYCKACCKEKFITNRYGLSGPQWRALRHAQGYRCRICGVHEDDLSRPLYVDHDHSHCPGSKGCALCVRGLLCMRCNTGIGHLNHSPDQLRAAIDYLQEFSAGWLLSVPELDRSA